MGKKPFGQRVREARRAAGMTQPELARKMRVTDAMISRWETGKNFPAEKNLRRLAAALGVTLSSLLE